MGLLISSAFKRSSSALLVAILVWVTAVGLLPGLSIELARFISPLPSQVEIDERLMAAQASVREELEQVREEAHRASAQGKRSPKEVRLRRHDLAVKSGRLMWQVSRDYLNRMFRQRRVALTPMALSPSASLDVAACALAGTDAISMEYFMTFARTYAEDFGRFSRLQVADRKNWSLGQMPVFHEQVESIGDALGRVAGFLLAPLVLFGLCFLGAQLTFSRYEVRRE
jgi:hypothetical protein